MTAPNSSAPPGRLSVVKGEREETPPANAGLFFNRELSWLAFNERVLQEAADASLPLYERLKFLAIVSTNFDEFFMIRVAGLKQQILGRVAEVAADGMTPAEQLKAIHERVHRIVEEQDRIFQDEVRPALVAQGVQLIEPGQFSPEQRDAARKYFRERVLPALTPLAVDTGHPFPHLKNKSLNIAVLLVKQVPRRRSKVARETLLAVVQVPAVLGRLVPLPSASSAGGGGLAVLLLGDLIAHHAADLFPGYVVKHTVRFRVTRNSDLLVDEEESEDLLSTMQEELRRRELGAAVRLELREEATDETMEMLRLALKLEPQDVYKTRSPLQLGDLMQLQPLDPRQELRVEPLSPVTPPSLRDADSVFDVVAKRDVLLHHPYESFEPVVRFVAEAADDPNVLAIKHTLYRTSGDSPFVRALSRAAQNGKQVTAVVEIKARFDEANNIAWARRLEENGVHVVYGLVGLKVHGKMALVVRREGDGIRRYVHMGTGNYNPNTARAYTDLSLLTSRPEIAEDAAALFNLLTGYADPPTWNRLAVAPYDLPKRVEALIVREMERAKAGEPARIQAKMNALVDPTTIRALYAASQAGVEIDLIVRGICCLRPGVAGLSEKIRVTSVVDRFLEHSRVFAFGVGEKMEVWISSADWMPRNFVRRIEIMCPVEDPAIKRRLCDDVIGMALRDNVKARRLSAEGEYQLVENSGARVRAQTALLEGARITLA